MPFGKARPAPPAPPELERARQIRKALLEDSQHLCGALPRDATPGTGARAPLRDPRAAA
jgi:hypothetical protein